MQHKKRKDITMDNIYNQAYLFTNEPLNEIMSLLPVRDANVLTITASGDQTLFFYAYDAKHIDTVDFSVGAPVITDIKIAAIKSGMKYDMFYDFIFNMKQKCNSELLKYIAPLQKHIPETTIKYLESQSDRSMFMFLLPPKYKLTPEQYNKIQSLEISHPKYTLCDINDIHKHTNKKYDIIYISNIFETSPADFLRFAQKTQHLLNPNGVFAHHAIAKMQNPKLTTDKWKIKETPLTDNRILRTLFRTNSR